MHFHSVNKINVSDKFIIKKDNKGVFICNSHVF